MPDTTIQQKDEKDVSVNPLIREMMEAGVFYGRTKNKTHPSMRTHVTVNRNGVDIVDLESAAEMLTRTLAFIEEKVRGNATFLLVASQPAAREAAEAVAKEFDIPYVTTRWVGGTLTNFGVIQDRLGQYRKLKKDLKNNAFESYTKKEKLDLEREAEKLDELWQGLANLTERPNVLIVIDPAFHKTAVREARRTGVPVVAFANTDADPSVLDHFVVGNTSARSSISWFLGHLTSAFRNAKKQIEMQAAKQEE